MESTRTGSPSTAAGATSARSTRPRTGRRERPVHRYNESFFDRYRGLLLGAFALAGVLLIGWVFLNSANAKSYTCDSLLTPPPGASTGPSASAAPTSAPTATPAASPTASGSAGASASPSPTPTPGPNERLGFVTQDLGRNHLTTKSNNKPYAYCPPASGPHYNIAGVGPIKRDFYGPQSELDPGSWIHNLEHGYVVLLYSCGQNGQSCPSQAEMDLMRRWFNEAPTDAGATACKLPNKVVVARFDAMSTRFAVLAWDRVMLMNSFDLTTALKFAQQWIDGPSAPEPPQTC